MDDLVGGTANGGIPAAARRRGFLGRLPAEVADQVLRQAVLVRHPSGSISDGATPAVLLTGLVRHYLSAPDGRQITIRYVGVGDLVGTAFSTASDPATGSQALEPSTLLHLDSAGLEARAQQCPELALALVAEMTHGLRDAYRTLAVSAFATVESRVAGDLIERARATGDLRPGVRLRASHQDLADATGSVREVVSRSLRELRCRGVVATNHSSVVILDVDALFRAAGLEGLEGSVAV
jgi:CRP/FNR family transcriptional regulator